MRKKKKEISLSEIEEIKENEVKKEIESIKTETREVKPSKVNSRVALQVLFGSHIALFVHKEQNTYYIIAKTRVFSLQECVRINNKHYAFKIDTTKPTLIWGNIRLYLIDCETSQQFSLNPNEKVIDIATIENFVYKEDLFKLTRNVHKANMQNLSLLIGFVIGFCLMGLIMMILINSGVF